MDDQLDDHVRPTYNDIHNLIKNASVRIAEEFAPNLLIAIGGGGFFPARVMRTYLKDPTTARNIPIQAIGLSLYESLPGTTVEKLGSEVIRTQWLGPETKTLLGRRALIVDEVDDTRQTLHYAVSELQKDVERELALLPDAEREPARTSFAVFVVHNKLKPKLKELPPDVPYYSGAEAKDVWLDYPWEGKEALIPFSEQLTEQHHRPFSRKIATDIEEHDRLSNLAKLNAQQAG